MKIYRSKPITVLFLLFVMVPLISGSFYVYKIIASTLVDNSGEVMVKGVKSPVTISREENGVTHIKAEFDSDAFYAIGVAHAQDRLWQLEIQRRMSSGTLAEIFGKGAVNFDIYIRTLGIRSSAEASWNSLNQESQQSLESYVSGVNSWIEKNHQLPLEFMLLGITPQPWSPIDSLAWLKMFSLSLAGNYQEDLNRLITRQTLGQVKAQNLLADVNISSPVTVPEMSAEQLDNLAGVLEYSKSLERKWGIGGKNIGSNAWVISGEHSADGKATLANDPHLALDLPSQWYAVSVKADELHVAGMSLVGLPLVILGKNEHIAWGGTNMMADTMDLYYEEINTADNSQYRRGDRWLDFQEELETIHVKADFPAFLRAPLEPLELKIRRTDHGPIITDLIGSAEHAISLRWLGAESDDGSYNAFLKLNYANDWRSFKAAMQEHKAPALNLFFIDREDNIGYLGVGKIPVRGKGTGALPVNGADLDSAWLGYIPLAEMPQSFNPEQGYLFSANNNVAGANYAYAISNDWAEPERAEQIDHLINQHIARGSKLSIPDHKRMHLDMTDRQALKVLPELLNVESGDEDINHLLKYLNEWDGNADSDSVAATIFFTWTRHLKRHLFLDDFKGYWGNPAIQMRQRSIVRSVSLLRLRRALSDSRKAVNDPSYIDWCDKIDTTEHETCTDIKLEALEDTHYQLTKLLGSDMDDWDWGRAHKAEYNHRPFSSFKGLDIFFERRISTGGSPNAINVSSFHFDPNEGYIQSVGATFRQIMNFSDDDENHIFINATGQSGNVVSKNYDDMMDDFIEGRYHELSSNPVAFHSITTLIPSATSTAKGVN